MSTRIDAIKTLSLFNQKVDEIENSRFWKAVSGGTAGIRFVPEYEGEDVPTLYGVSKEDIEYFLNRWRMVTASRERISTKRLNKLYGELPIDPKLFQHFESVRDTMKATLDKQILNDFGTPLALSDYIDTVLYGDILHVEGPKRERWEGLNESPARSLLTQYWMIPALSSTVLALFYIRSMNKYVITLLEESS